MSNKNIVRFNFFHVRIFKKLWEAQELAHVNSVLMPGRVFQLDNDKDGNEGYKGIWSQRY